MTFCCPYCDAYVTVINRHVNALHHELWKYKVHRDEVKLRVSLFSFVLYLFLNVKFIRVDVGLKKYGFFQYDVDYVLPANVPVERQLAPGYVPPEVIKRRRQYPPPKEESESSEVVFHLVFVLLCIFVLYS